MPALAYNSGLPPLINLLLSDGCLLETSVTCDTLAAFARRLLPASRRFSALAQPAVKLLFHHLENGTLRHGCHRIKVSGARCSCDRRKATRCCHGSLA